MRCLLLSATALLPALLLSAEAPAWGGDFRVDTKIYQGDAAEPVAHNLTLFHAGRVYDFVLVDDQETSITIYDPRNSQFVLLLPERSVKTVIDAGELLKFTSFFKVRGSNSEDPLVKFCSVPEFTEVFDESTLEVTLTGDRMSYRVRGLEPPESSVLQEYRQFNDWFTRLNSARPGAMPPFARLELNKATANKQIIPVMVERTIHPRNRLTGRPEVVRSEHTNTWRLLDSDLQRIQRAGENLARYREVRFDQYYGF